MSGFGPGGWGSTPHPVVFEKKGVSNENRLEKNIS
jgi:hypothetical protein